MTLNTPTQLTAAADLSAKDRFEWIHGQIRDRICLLDYAPGTRLSEVALAEEFGISRTPLRRVLGRLEDEGLLQSVHGAGTFVTEVSLEELEQTFQLRMELAGLLGQLSPKQDLDEIIGTFHRLADRSLDGLQDQDPRAFAQLLTDFFRTTLLLTDNQPLRDTAERLYYRTARFWLQSVFASRLDLAAEMEIFHRELKDVIGALQIGDLHAAALMQRAHISMSFVRMKAGQLSAL